jgi:hypothetical protein
MDLQRVIDHVRACVEDGEWERADAGFSELHVEELIARTRSPRIAGAIAHTLAGASCALGRHDGIAASTALGHLAFLVGDHGEAARQPGG